MANRMLFEHPTKRGVIVDENGREVSVEELSMGESGSNHTMCEAITDFNELATGSGVRISEADQKLVEAWKTYGLCEEGARIAANIHEAAVPFKDDTEFWVNFKFGGR